MKKVIASAGLLALGAISLQTARAEMMAGSEKPWSLSGTLRGFYDDNYNTVPDGPGRNSSWGFEIRPSIAVKYNEGPTSLTADYTYSLKDFLDRPGKKLDQAHQFDFTFNHAFSERHSADIEESFVSSQEPEVLSGTGATAVPLRANGDNYHNTVGINFHAQLTKQLGLVLGYNNSWVEYTGGNATPGQPSYGALLDSFTHTFSVDGRWQYDLETVFILGYKFISQNYYSTDSLRDGKPPGSPGYVAPASRDNYSHIAYVGLEHSFRSDLSLDARVGIQASDYYNHQNVGGTGTNPDSLSPYADLSLNYTYTDSGQLRVGFRHAKNQTDVGFDATGNLTQDEESSTLYMSVVQVLKPISPDLTGTLTFQYQDSAFNGAFTSAGEDFYMIGFNLSYAFTHFLSAEFGYNYDLLDSALAGRGYDRNRVYAGVTATY